MPFVDRFAYSVGLGAVLLVLISIPVLLWPATLGKYFNKYLWIGLLVVCFFLAPFARRYIKRIK